jgi:Rha family phage regulatory protein
MNALISTVNPVTMTSREIAELTGKDHGNVMRDIRAMVDAISTDSNLNPCAKSTTYAGRDGRQYPQYELDKDTCLTLLLGYDAVARMKVVKRWQELEAAAAPALPNFSNPAEAARAWALEYEARQLAERTKAEIGTRREATAMNTASQAVKKAAALERELDKAKDYASVKRMEMLYHGTRFNWRLLKSAAAEMGVPAIDVFDANYGTVKAYHASVWMEAYAVSIDAKECA